MMSNKRSIEWHEECLNNMKSFLIRLEKQMNDLKYNIKRLKSDIDLKSNQINKAYEKGMTEFDCKKFGISKKSKSK